MLLFERGGGLPLLIHPVRVAGTQILDQAVAHTKKLWEFKTPVHLGPGILTMNWVSRSLQILWTWFMITHVFPLLLVYYGIKERNLKLSQCDCESWLHITALWSSRIRTGKNSNHHFPFFLAALLDVAWSVTQQLTFLTIFFFWPRNCGFLITQLQLLFGPVPFTCKRWLIGFRVVFFLFFFLFFLVN